MQTISTFQFPPGVRFHPSDEELIVYYLLNKLNSRPLPAAVIGEVELYNYNPWDLPKKAPFGDAEWYFFSPRDRKYPNGARPNRTAASGYWKATGTDKPILSSSGSRIGVKKALVFYIGKPPNGVKTDWIMIEYRISDTLFRPQRSKASMRLDDWVLCRIRQKGNMSKNNAWDINPYSPNNKLMGGSTDQQSSVNNYYTNNNINNNNNSSETICPNYFLSQDCNLLASLLVSQAFPPTICTNITTTTTTNSQSQSPSQSQSSNSTAKNCVDPPYVPGFMINKESSDDHDHHYHHDHQVINSNNSDTKITPQHLMNNKNENNHLNSNNMLAENVSSCFFNQDVYRGRDELKHNLSNAIGNLHEFDMSAALFAEKFLQ